MKKQINWHLIPVIGFIALWTHADQFNENNPWNDNFINSDSTKDPVLFWCFQGVSIAALVAIIYMLIMFFE